MKRERFEPIAGPAPRMSQATRADIEALRASDRLQRIFESDFRARRGPAAGRDRAGGSAGAGDQPGEAPDGLSGALSDGAIAGGRRGLLSSRRARLLVGLVPLYIGLAVLAAEGLSALRDQPGRAALVAAVSRADRVGPGPARDEAASFSAGKAVAAPEVEAAGTGRIGVAPAKEAVPADRGVARVGTGAVPAGDPAAPDRAETDGARMALAPATQERAVARTAAPAAERDSGGGPGRRGAEVRAVEPRAGAAKASDDLAKAIERGPAAGRLAGQRAPDAGAAAVAAPLAAAVAAPLAAAAPEEGIEAVPQPTWSPRGAPPVPAPAPRFARLSEVLAQDGGRGMTETAQTGSRPREAQEARRPAAESSAQRPTAAASAQGEVSRQQSGSAPPRIVVHYRGASGASAARRVAAELRARGFARTELRPVSFGIAQANVRYFHDQNRPAAREVNELLGSMWRRSDLRDFTHYAPLPTVGTVEVWLPG